MESAQEKNVVDWSRSGYILFNTREPGQPLEIWSLAPGSGRKPFRVASAQDNLEQGQISPDGTFLVYRAVEGPRTEVFVQDFPSAQGKWQVSSQGGSEPQWRRGAV
jgi:Tol biopolymer transport system component